ncbi:MAG: AMP-binding protein, partial [Ignavibacteriaceae bacterium]
MSEQFRFTKGQKTRPVIKEELVFKPSPEFKKEAHFSSYNQYKNIYDFSISNPEKFWGSEAKELYWFKQWKEVKKGKAFSSKWFTNGKTNVSYNCLDRHIETDKRNKAAIIWESETGDTRIYTYQLLHTKVCKFANALIKLGVKKGDNIIIYMGMVPEAVIAMFACARIGAVHSVIFNGLRTNAVSERIRSLDCKTIITQDFFLRKGNKIPLKENVDNAIGKNPIVENVIVYKRFESAEMELTAGRDHLWRELLESTPDNCEAVPLDSQHPLFSMFTNGPRGQLVKTLHTTGGYMVQVYISARWLFDLKDEDIVWTTSDIGWISCHSYGIYGPLLNGATTFLYEGVPIYPEPDRYWQLISKFRINIFFTTPTTLRA